MVNDESIHDRAKQQSVTINLRAIKLKEQSDREYIFLNMVVLLCNIFREYCCASVQYFLHNHAHRCFQSSHAQCSSWPTSCATSTSRRRQGLACDPALAQCPPWSVAWRVEFFIIWREFDVRDYFWKKTAASCQICRGWWRKAIVMFFFWKIHRQVFCLTLNTLKISQDAALADSGIFQYQI